MFWEEGRAAVAGDNFCSFERKHKEIKTWLSKMLKKINRNSSKLFTKLFCNESFENKFLKSFNFVSKIILGFPAYFHQNLLKTIYINGSLEATVILRFVAAT